MKVRALYKSLTITALLPIKAHSARVKSKNFRMIAGKPLFRWILDALTSVSEIDKVVINTDASELLAAEGLRHGDYDGCVIIRDRPEEICGDFVSMNRVLENDIDNVPSDIYFMTHTTNPLLSPGTIRDMISKYYAGLEQGKDSLFTVNQLQTRFYTKDVHPINHDPDNLIRTQDLPPYFEENSVGYFFSGKSFKETSARIGRSPIMYTTPALESVDIDEITDWFVAESLLMRVAEGVTLPTSWS